jgi:predicted TIM-barrel fold metal-dependent hydrolase
VRIDAHLHVYPDRAAGRADIAGYPIVEYGEKDGVRRSARDGDPADAIAALDAAGLDAACVLQSFELPGNPWPAGPRDGGRWPLTDPPHGEHADALRASNAFVGSLHDVDPRLLPFVSVHPGVLSARACGAHVAELADAGRARGLKLHTIGQRIHPADPAMWPTYAALSERGLPLVAHCGPDRHGAGLSTPAAFASVAAAFPDLKLVLAHLGGGAWRDTGAFAAAHPGVRFDLSEVVSWTGSTLGPTGPHLSALIRAIGAERVLLGSDFPWYEPADVIAAVEELPGLTTEERALILGANAAALLGLD